MQVKILKITDEAPKDRDSSQSSFSKRFDQIHRRKRTMVGSMVSSFIGSPGQTRKTFISSLIGDENHRNESKPKRKLNPVYIMIPTVFDIAETLCSNIALTLIAASITQMLRATLIIFTACFSVWILKMRLYRHHYLALLLIIVGLVCVGLS